MKFSVSRSKKSKRVISATLLFLATTIAFLLGLKAHAQNAAHKTVALKTSNVEDVATAISKTVLFDQADLSKALSVEKVKTALTSAGVADLAVRPNDAFEVVDKDLPLVDLSKDLHMLSRLVGFDVELPNREKRTLVIALRTLADSRKIYDTRMTISVFTYNKKASDTHSIEAISDHSMLTLFNYNKKGFVDREDRL